MRDPGNEVGMGTASKPMFSRKPLVTESGSGHSHLLVATFSSHGIMGVNPTWRRKGRQLKMVSQTVASSSVTANF